MSSRSKKAILGFATDVGGVIAVSIISFVAAPTILKLTSQTLYGFWVTTVSILGYLALADIGLGMSLTRFVAAAASKNDPDELNKLISTAFVTFCGIGLIFFLVGISIMPYIPDWFQIPKEESVMVLEAYRLAIVSGALALPLSVFNSVVVGFQRMAVMNVSKNIITITSIALSVGLLYMDIGLISLPIGSLFIVLVGALVAFFFAKHYFPRLRLSLNKCNKKDLKKLISFGGYFQLGRIANTVALNSDNVVIASTIGSGAVTPYAFTSKLPVMFSVTLASKLPIAIFPAITDMFAKKEYDKLRATYKRLMFFSVRMACFAGALMYLINEQFVNLWVGEENFGGDMLNLVFVLWAVFDTIYRGTTAIVYASGDLRNWSIAALIEAFLNIGFSLLFVQFYGLAGIALGTLLSKLCSTGFYIPYWVCRKINLSVKKLLIDAVFLPFLRSLPSFIITIIFAQLLSLSLGWLWLICVSGVLVISNFMMFELIALARPSAEPLKLRLKKLILMQEKY